MEEILEDPARFKEQLSEREKPPVKPVKNFVSPVPSRQSGCQRTSERMSQSDTVRAGWQSHKVGV